MGPYFIPKQRGLTSFLSLQGFLQEPKGTGLSRGGSSLAVLLQHLEHLRVLFQIEGAVEATARNEDPVSEYWDTPQCGGVWKDEEAEIPIPLRETRPLQTLQERTQLCRTYWYLNLGLEDRGPGECGSTLTTESLGLLWPA